jgi:hypothetical protein
MRRLRQARRMPDGILQNGLLQIAGMEIHRQGQQDVDASNRLRIKAYLRYRLNTIFWPEKLLRAAHQPARHEEYDDYQKRAVYQHMRLLVFRASR